MAPLDLIDPPYAVSGVEHLTAVVLGAAPLTVSTGAVLGVLVSLSPIGVGALGMTVLLLPYPRLPIARLVGSDIAPAVIHAATQASDGRWRTYA
jgi:uncharacterized protein